MQEDKKVVESAQLTVIQFSLKEILRRNATNILGVFLCWAIGVFAGYLFPSIVNADVLSELLQTFESAMKEFAVQPIQSAIMNGARSAVMLYLGMLLGVIFALPPVYLLLSEGIFTGSMIASHHELWKTLLPLDPPSLLEFYCACVALGFGVKIGLSLLSSPRLVKFRVAIWEANRVYLRLVLPLLLFSVMWRIISALFQF